MYGSKRVTRQPRKKKQSPRLQGRYNLLYVSFHLSLLVFCLFLVNSRAYLSQHSSRNGTADSLQVGGVSAMRGRGGEEGNC